MQVFADYNIEGMNYVAFSNVKVRLEHGVEHLEGSFLSCKVDHIRHLSFDSLFQ